MADIVSKMFLSLWLSVANFTAHLIVDAKDAFLPFLKCSYPTYYLKEQELVPLVVQSKASLFLYVIALFEHKRSMVDR